MEPTVVIEPAKPPKKLRGFAGMTPEKRREISRKGGASVPKEKRTFSKNNSLAKKAGAAGGKNVPADKRSFSINRELASDAGTKGGKISAKNKNHVVHNVHTGVIDGKSTLD